MIMVIWVLKSRVSWKTRSRDCLDMNPTMYSIKALYNQWPQHVRCPGRAIRNAMRTMELTVYQSNGASSYCTNHIIFSKVLFYVYGNSNFLNSCYMYLSKSLKVFPMFQCSRFSVIAIVIATKLFFKRVFLGPMQFLVWASKSVCFWLNWANIFC